MVTNLNCYPNLIDGTGKTSSANIFKEQDQAAMDFYPGIKTNQVHHG